MMQTLINFIDSFSNLIIAIGVVLNLYFTFRSLQKIETVHIATNSMKDELVKEVREASLAKGKMQGRQEMKSERSE